ncbi:MAG: tetratricopeptide repeat protein [Alphaproteobacteria bacterium]|jgi:tetratricopeptide (TPR) repeat protein|nr:tetratricopeptide repeat protein [Alphaproteobacteria bacterium]
MSSRQEQMAHQGDREAQQRGPESPSIPSQPGAADGQDDVLQLAVQHHQGGRLAEAAGLYRLVIENDPSNAEAFRLLGLLHFHQGDNASARQLVEQVIEMAPQNATAHADLGNVFASTGDAESALESYQRAATIAPEAPEILAVMGQHLRNMGRAQDALEPLETAAELAPQSAEVLTTLATVLQETGDLDGAVKNYRRALSIKPDLAAAHANLGLALFHLEDLDGAIEHDRKAVELNPNAPETHFNLGWALFCSKYREEAERCFQKTIALDPSHAEGHLKLALARLADHDRDGAQLHFDQAAALARSPLKIGAKFKFEHDIQQYRHLYAKGLIDGEAQSLIAHLEMVRDALPGDLPHDRVFALGDTQTKLLGETYGAPHHLPECPALEGPAINPRLDRAALEKSYFKSDPEVLTVDGLLSQEALTKLRAFCREATIWQDIKPGYLGTYLKDGFCTPLLLQIADEMRTALPAIFGDHPLIELWSYKCDQDLQGLDVHADCAAVNVNFWISPDDANCDPDSGGLVLYPKEAPMDWPFARYNHDRDAIHDFVAQCDNEVTVPHRSNRAVIFNSNLFHKTDDVHFRSGYINRRTNVTMLFGHRASK